jgi:O-antigen/teichoic acid export membrane protein
MLKSTVIYFVGRFGSAVITMVSVAIYTRLMAPDEYGVYALVMSGALVAYAATMQWLALSLGRFLPEYQDQEAVVLSHVAMVYGATTLLVLASAGILVPWLVPTTEMRAVLILGVGVFLATTPAELTLINFQMRGNAYRYVQFTLLRVMVAAAIGVTLAYLGWGSVGVLSGVIAGHLCIVLPNLAGTWGSVRRSLLCKQLFRELAAYGLPFAATGALAAVIHASDRYIIGVLIGTDAAGLYAAPYDLAMRSLYVLMLVVAMAGNPLILRACEEGGEAAARPLIRRQVELLLGLALPAAIAFVLLSPAIVNVFLGEAFQATARELMPWIVAATVLNGFQAFYLALAFSVPKRPTLQIYVFIVGAVVNTVLNFVLIPRMGLIGAAVATVLAYVLIVIMSFLTARKLFPLPWPQAGFLGILAACAVWALILWPARDDTALAPVLLHCLVGAVAYLAVLIVLDVGDTRHLFARCTRIALGIMRPGRFGWKR